jgi:hypothetical protein
MFGSAPTSYPFAPLATTPTNSILVANTENQVKTPTSRCAWHQCNTHYIVRFVKKNALGI